MILAHHITQDITVETASSFLKSSPLHLIGKLSIAQIDKLLFMLPQAYAVPADENERSQAIIKRCLLIRRDQLVERQFHTIQYGKKRLVNESLASTYQTCRNAIFRCLPFLRFLFKPAQQSGVMKSQKLQSKNDTNQQPDSLDKQLSPLLPKSKNKSSKRKGQKRNK